MRLRLPFLLLLLVASLPPPVTGQGSELFPEARLGELREEVVYEAPEKVEEPELPEWDIDWEKYRKPLTILLSLVVILALGILIYLILGDLDIRKKNVKTAQSGAVAVSEIVEEELVEHGVDTSLLERAEAAGQYDIAVRLHYIGLLKQLRDARAITYRQDFSNRDYVRQLADSPLREDFRTVTASYERYWYGKYRIDRLSYRLVSRQFAALGERITAPAGETTVGP